MYLHQTESAREICLAIRLSFDVILLLYNEHGRLRPKICIASSGDA